MPLPLNVISGVTSSINITTSSLNSPFWKSISTGTPSSILVSGASFASPKTTYVLFSKEIEVSGYHDVQTAIIVSLINVLGIEYYINLKMQGTLLNDELSSFLEEEVKSYNRDKKIKSLTDVDA